MPNQVASYLSRYLCFREPNWLDELSITLQVLGSTFGGSEFQADVKKKFACLHVKAHGKWSQLAGPLSHGQRYGLRHPGWGTGLGGFSTYMSGLLIANVRRVLYPRRFSFFYSLFSKGLIGKWCSEFREASIQGNLDNDPK